MFKDRTTLRMKLILGFGVTLVIFLAVVISNVYQMQRIHASMNEQRQKVGLEQKTLELKVLAQEIKDISSGIMISRNMELVDKYNRLKPAFEQTLKEIGSQASTPEQFKWRSQMIVAGGDFLNSFDQAVKIIQDQSLTDDAVRMNTEYLYNQTQDQRDRVFRLVDNFHDVYKKEAESAVAASDKLMKRTEWIMLLAGLAVFLFAAVISTGIIHSFTRSIRRLQSAVSLLADGDLSHQIGSVSKDELGELSRDFDRMVEQVRRMLSESKHIASELTRHSGQFYLFSQETASANANILKAIEEIAAGAESQARVSEASSHIVQELDNEISEIWSSANVMLEKSGETEHYTRKGSKAVKQLKEASGQTVQVVEYVGAAMQTLAASSKEIGQIISAITEIAAQTNILSLNASIEAARAGTYGKGFSVIAEEVRLLSDQTGQSSQNITRVVHSLQKQISELESNVAAVRQVLATQSEKVEDTKSAFSAIHGSMTEVADHISRVHEKVDTARNKNSELVHSFQSVASMAQETAAGAEEVNAASVQQDVSIRKITEQSGDIRKLSEQLFEEIKRFRMEEDTAM